MRYVDIVMEKTLTLGVTIDGKTKYQRIRVMLGGVLESTSPRDGFADLSKELDDRIKIERELLSAAHEVIHPKVETTTASTGGKSNNKSQSLLKKI